MPVYEYYCRSCDGIFEALRPMSRSSAPAPCPVCQSAGERIMPTSFAAFTFREGYPRKLPDKGTYWHLGKEVKQLISGPARPWEHPEINKPEPPPRKSKGAVEVEREKNRLRRKELDKMRDSGVHPAEHRLPKPLR
jgi:putative FmdB family regulatory protein